MSPSLHGSGPGTAEGKWDWGRRLAAIAATLALWLASMSLPLAPDVGLHYSWHAALADAFVQGRQFGPDIVFTYGPWGFLGLDGMMPGAVTAKLVWELLGRLAFSATVVTMTATIAGLRRWVFLAAVIATACFFETGALVILALLALIWLLPANVRGWQRALAIAWLAFLAHFKFVFCLEAVAAVTLVSAVHALEGRRREALLLPAGFVGAYVAAWLAAGQSLWNLPRFLHLSWEISSGYSWAMGQDPTAAVLVAGLVVLAWCGAFVWLIWRSERTRAQRAGAALLVVAAWLLAWKQGFTRADSHTFGFFLAAFLLGLALPGLFRGKRRFSWQDLNVALCLWGTAAIAPELLTLPPRVTWQQWGRNLPALPNLRTWKAEYATNLRNASAAARNPVLQETIGENTVDLLTFEQGIVFLNGLNYRPRPVIQSYSAYTTELVKANGRFFQSEHAPEFVIVRLHAIDGRYPGQDDALALAEFARRYDVVRVEGDYTLLKRKASGPDQREFARAPLLDVVPRFGEHLLVPEGNGHPVWMEVKCRPTWLGQLRAFFYHAAPAGMTLTTSDGSELGFRLISTAADAGFIVRPLLLEHGDLAQLVNGRGSRWTKAIRFDLDRPSSRWFWRRPRVRFFAMTDLPLVQSHPFDALVEAGVINVRPLSVQTGATLNRLIADGHSLLFSHAPSEIVLPVEGGVRRFEGGCAFVDGAYRSGHTDGAVFGIEALIEGEWKPLWQRTLEPVNDASHQGFQRFGLELPPGASQLRLRITPGARNDASWDWTCWGDLRLR